MTISESNRQADARDRELAARKDLNEIAALTGRIADYLSNVNPLDAKWDAIGSLGYIVEQLREAEHAAYALRNG